MEEEALIAAIPVAVAVIGAALTFLFSQRAARSAHLQQLAANAYIDFFKGVSKIAMGQKHRGEATANAYIDFFKRVSKIVMGQKHDGEAMEMEGELLLVDAKARLCAYADEPVVAALAHFWRQGAVFDTPGHRNNMVNAVHAVRAAAGRKSVRHADVSQLLFSDDGVSNDAVKTNAEPEEENMADDDSGTQAVEQLLEEAKRTTLQNYNGLVQAGNPPGQNTAQTAFIVYMAKSLSSLSKSQLEHLRSQGVLTF